MHTPSPIPDTGTIHVALEGVYYPCSTLQLVDQTVLVLRHGDVILGDGDTDYACADMLEIFAELHRVTGINLEQLWQVREFAIRILDGRWTP